MLNTDEYGYKWRGELSPPPWWGMGSTVVGDGMSSSLAGEIVSGEAGTDSLVRWRGRSRPAQPAPMSTSGRLARFDVFSSDGATVVREPVGAMVSSEARAEVDDESDGAMVPSAGKADTDSCAVGAIVSRPVDASVASPIDVGAAEKADGDGGAPAATRKEGIVPANELVDNKPGTMFRCVEATTPLPPISKEQ